MKARVIFLGFWPSPLASCACKKKEASLSLLVWEATRPRDRPAPSRKPSVQSHGHLHGSSDELVAKLRGGSASNYDVISPSSDVAGSIARHRPCRSPRSSSCPSYSQLLRKAP